MKTVSRWPSSSRPAAAAWALCLSAMLLPVSADAACSINATPVPFGPSDRLHVRASRFDGHGVVPLHRERTEPHDYAEQGRSGSYSRAMQSGAGQLAYNLYRDASRATVWGDGTGGTGTYQMARPPRNQWVDVTVFGRIAPGQDASIGSYADSVIVTLEY